MIISSSESNQYTSKPPKPSKSPKSPIGGKKVYTYTPTKPKRTITFDRAKTVNTNLNNSAKSLSDFVNANKDADEKIKATNMDSNNATQQNSDARKNAKANIAAQHNPDRFEPSAMGDNEASRERVRRDIFRKQSQNQHLFEPSKKNGLHKGLISPKAVRSSNTDLIDKPNNLRDAMNKAENYQNNTSNFKSKITKQFTNRDYWNRDIKPAISSVISTLQR